MASNKKAKTVNLAFQGGGAHGAVTWGVADRLLEDEHLDIEAISGSSAGALNAVSVAYGLHKGGCDGARETLNTVWQEVSNAGQLYNPVRGTPFEKEFGGLDLMSLWSYQVFDTLTRSFSPYQFNPFDVNPLRDVLEKCIDFESLKRCDVTKLFLAATNVRSGKIHVFNTKDMSKEVVLASACLPFLFKAVEIDGEHYWDGGYMGNPVLFPFFYEAEARDIIIVHVNPIERDEVPQMPADIMNRVNEITFNSSLMRELRAISFVHKLLDEGWIKDNFKDRLSNVRIHSIRSDEALVDYDIASKFKTDMGFLNELKERGRSIADDWLDGNFNNIGNVSSVNLREMFDS